MISAFSSDEWFGCSASNMNFVEKHAFNDINSINELKEIMLINNSKEVVKYFKQSDLQSKLIKTRSGSPLR